MIFWGTFFPLISELFTGNKTSLAAPWFDHYTTPLAILLVLFTGIGPLLAWRRVSWASARRVFRVPLAVAARGPGRPWRCSPTPPTSPGRFALFVFAAFAIAGLRPGVLATAPRRAARLSGGSIAGGAGRGRLPQPAPLRRLHRPHRHRRAADRDRRLLELPDQPRTSTLKPGESAVVDGRKITYVRPTSSGRQREAITLRRRARGRRRTASTFAAATRAAASSARPASPRPAPSPDYFDGEATSEVGLKAGSAQRHLDRGRTRHQRRPAPSSRRRQRLRSLRRRRARDAAAVQSAGGVDARPPRRTRACAPTALGQIDKLQLADRRTDRPTATSPTARAATFKVIVNPLVIWMWIGGLISA